MLDLVDFEKFAKQVSPKQAEKWVMLNAKAIASFLAQAYLYFRLLAVDFSVVPNSA